MEDGGFFSETRLCGHNNVIWGKQNEELYGFDSTSSIEYFGSLNRIEGIQFYKDGTGKVKNPAQNFSQLRWNFSKNNTVCISIEWSDENTYYECKIVQLKKGKLRLKYEFKQGMFIMWDFYKSRDWDFYSPIFSM
ncbi:MAG: hypothetical protein LBU90_09625 [Bacteroidales bacterium]|nr:hypothetical protein [Bacteroidales bacterium]